MLCIRPAKVVTLCITDAGVTGYAKNRGQPDILENLNLWKRIKNEPKKIANLDTECYIFWTNE